MKKFAKKALSAVLTLSLSITLLVPAFAYKANTSGITDFYCSDYFRKGSKKIDVFRLIFSDMKMEVCSKNSFRFVLRNSEGIIADQTSIKDISFLNFVNEKDEYIGKGLTINCNIPTENIKGNEDLTLVIEAGAFTYGDGQLSSEISIDFQLKEFYSLGNEISDILGPAPLSFLFAPFIVFYAVFILIGVFLFNL